jgi:hypothetical protein
MMIKNRKTFILFVCGRGVKEKSIEFDTFGDLFKDIIFEKIKLVNITIIDKNMCVFVDEFIRFIGTIYYNFSYNNLTKFQTYIINKQLKEDIKEEYEKWLKGK